MIYYFDDLKKASDNIHKMYNILPEFRKSKINKYKFPVDKVLSAVAYTLLLFAANQNNIKFNFKIDKYGKPYDAYGNMQFNLSHCKNAVACIISDAPVGIDVESIVNINCYNTIVSKVCSEQEISLLMQSEDSLVDFTKIWTLKESYTKMMGQGIVLDLKEVSFLKYSCFFSSLTFDNYVLSYCSNQYESIIYVSFEELINFVENIS